jgi:hypothetical protein
MNQTSPLLRLPGEIRNCIYEYVIGGNEIIPACLRHLERSIVLLSRADDNWESPPMQPSDIFNLSRVCRQLRIETHVLPFKLNVINNSLFDFHFASFLADLKPIYKQTITTIALGLGERTSSEASHYRNIWPEGMSECTSLTTIILKVALDHNHFIRLKGYAERNGLKLITGKSKGTPNLECTCSQCSR